jgi:hypothetical protein
MCLEVGVAPFIELEPRATPASKRKPVLRVLTILHRSDLICRAKNFVLLFASANLQFAALQLQSEKTDLNRSSVGRQEKRRDPRAAKLKRHG